MKALFSTRLRLFTSGTQDTCYDIALPAPGHGPLDPPPRGLVQRLRTVGRRRASDH